MSGINKSYDPTMFLLLVLCLLFHSCKTKHVDSEPIFKLNIVKSDIFKIKKYCFDDIRGMDKKPMEKICVDTIAVSIPIPIDLKRDTSIFIFNRKNRKDTLIVAYTISIGKGDDLLKAIVSNFRITRTTFDSIYIQPKVTSDPSEIEIINLHL